MRRLNRGGTIMKSPLRCKSEEFAQRMPKITEIGVARSSRWNARGDQGMRSVCGEPAVAGWRQRRVCWLLGACAVLSLAGCTSFPEYVRNGFKVGPNFTKPPAPVAQDWIDAGDVRIRKDEDEPIEWWSVFKDPALDTLVCLVYQQNLTLREAGWRVMESRAKYGIAVGNFFPQEQTGSGSYTRVQLSKNNANTPLGSRGLPLGRLAPERFFDQWALGFGLAWELDFWGRFRRSIEAARDDLDASVENYDDVLVTLIGDVAATYTQIRILEQQLKYVETNIELQKTTLKLAQANFKGGKTTELDVDQAV